MGAVIAEDVWTPLQAPIYTPSTKGEISFCCFSLKKKSPSFVELLESYSCSYAHVQNAGFFMFSKGHSASQCSESSSMPRWLLGCTTDISTAFWSPRFALRRNVSGYWPGNRQFLLRAGLLQTKHKTNKHRRPSITWDVLGNVPPVGLAAIVQKCTDNKGKWNPQLVLSSQWLVWLSRSLGKQFLF